MKQERTIQDCLEDVGAFGRFQLSLGIFYILVCAVTGYITFQFQSLSVAPSIKCKSYICHSLVESETTDADIMCTLSRGDDWEFLSKKNNWLTEFNLYCDKMYIVSMGTTVYFIGFFLTCFALSSVVDKLGRKRATSWFILGMVLTLVLLMACTTVEEILIVRFLLGAVHGGISISTTVLYYEFTSSDLATLFMMLTSASFSFGGGLSGLMSMWSDEWRETILPPLVVTILCGVFFQIFVPETPHWLFAKGYENSAIQSLNRVAKYNGTKILTNIGLISVSGEVTTSKKSQSFAILYRTPFLRKSLMCLAFCWFTVSICYYGLEFNAGSLGNEYVVMMLMGCFDFPFKIAMYVFAGRAGRKLASQTYLFLALICLVLTALPETELLTVYGNVTLKTILVASGRAFGGSVFAMMYIYTSEILPTLVRSVGISCCSTVARIGSFLAPLVILLNQVSPAIIYIFIVTCIIISLILLRNIPETNGKPLPNSLADCQRLFHNAGFISKKHEEEFVGDKEMLLMENKGS